jgi:hypothetical protein
MAELKTDEALLEALRNASSRKLTAAELHRPTRFLCHEHYQGHQRDNPLYAPPINLPPPGPLAWRVLQWVPATL